MLEKLDITRLEINGYVFYRVLTLEDVAAISVVPDTHLFLPDELLELAAYTTEHQAQFKREAKENNAREASTRTPEVKKRKYHKRKEHQD